MSESPDSDRHQELRRDLSGPDGEKVKLLRILAKEGFDSLDRGEGITLKDVHSLRALIAEIGRRVS